MSAERIVVFDGVCHFCNRWVQFLLRHDRAGRFRFAPMQGEAGRTLLAGHGLDADDPATFLLLRAGKAHVQTDAILHVLGDLGWPWRAAIALRIVPGALRDAGYRVLARNRYRWFGRRDVCVVPTDEQRARFLS
jgi:predicted DCC family thiol-disulfide oxidoreductase YuxK